jgi:hypothetical protein
MTGFVFVVVWLGAGESVRDLAEDVGNLGTHEQQNSDDDNGDQNKNQCVPTKP